MLRRGLAALLLSSMPVPYAGALLSPERAEERHHCGCTTTICCCHRPSGRSDADESKVSCCDSRSESALPSSVALVAEVVASGPDAAPTRPSTPAPPALALGFDRIETPPPQHRAS
jgi:hypothetical protein